MSKDRASQVRQTTGPLIVDPKLVAKIEARNALLQFDEIRRMAKERYGKFRISPSEICDLQKIAVQEIFSCAGTFRKVEISISNSPHSPPDWTAVPQMVEEMCNYAIQPNDDPFHVPAYLMWRLNWIHPFADGNGRTSRAVSYLALCANFEMDLPGKITVPELITQNKHPYYDALDAADLAWGSANKVDVSEMAKLIRDLLVEQLQSMETD